MDELKDELNAAPIDDWNVISYTENRHKWMLQWYRYGDDAFCFSFVSPKRRRYSFFSEDGRVIGADIAGSDNGARIASYWDSWGDSPARLNAVLRLTPEHIIDRLFMLLDTLKER